MAVLTSTHNLCFEQKYDFLSENFQFLMVKFSIYLNRRNVSPPKQMWRMFSRGVSNVFPQRKFSRSNKKVNGL